MLKPGFEQVTHMKLRVPFAAWWSRKRQNDRMQGGRDPTLTEVTLQIVCNLRFWLRNVNGE